MIDKAHCIICEKKIDDEVQGPISCNLCGMSIPEHSISKEKQKLMYFCCSTCFEIHQESLSYNKT